MSGVHLVLPATVDDDTRPSGGNRYDRHVASELVRLGWRVHEHLVAGPWPRRDPTALAALAAALALVPDRATVVVDGLLASPADDVLVPEAPRVRLVVLVHLPLGGADPAATDRERRVLVAAARVVVTSAWCRDRLVDLYGLDAARVVVARPGAEPAPLATGSATGGGLLSVGALTPVKGHDVLAVALSGLGDLPWRAAWVGATDLDPPHVEEVRTQLVRGGVDGRVRLTGPLPADAVGLEYAAADLLVLPSRVETYGMVLTEALARGLPVVASDVGGVREALGVAAEDRGDAVPGLLVPPDDPGALGRALRAWLADPALRRTLRAAAGSRRGTLPGWSTSASRLAEALVREPGSSGVRLPEGTP